MTNLKANRASETEEQRKERLRIRREENRKPRERATGHSQKIERGDDNEFKRNLRLEKVVAGKHFCC